MHKIMDTKNQQGITTFWGISIILIEAVVVVFVFYILYFFWIENPTPTSDISLVRLVNHQAVTMPSHVDTTGWLTLDRSDYYISVQYPDTWQISDDTITYGTTEGHIISFQDNKTEKFSLRVFPVKASESIPQALTRLTSIDPAIYQSHTERIDGREAIVYRQRPGRSTDDRIYFIGSGYLFEAPFNATTAPILSTFKFLAAQ